VPWIKLRDFVENAERHCVAAFNGELVLIEIRQDRNGPRGLSLQRFVEIDESRASEKHFFLGPDVKKTF
jgi:hypothetical protein